jgi:hypothetical protein
MMIIALKAKALTSLAIIGIPRSLPRCEKDGLQAATRGEFRKASHSIHYPLGTVPLNTCWLNAC